MSTFGSPGQLALGRHFQPIFRRTQAKLFNEDAPVAFECAKRKSGRVITSWRVSRFHLIVTSPRRGVGKYFLSPDLLLRCRRLCSNQRGSGHPFVHRALELGCPRSSLSSFRRLLVHWDMRRPGIALFGSLTRGYYGGSSFLTSLLPAQEMG